MSNLRLVPVLTALAAALALFALLPGAQPTVSAADCGPAAGGTIVIEIHDRSTGSRLSFGGADVLVDPDPRDFDLDQVVVDSDSTDFSGSEDQDPAAGVIRIDACSTEGNESYNAILLGLPGPFSECVVVNGADGGQVPVNTTLTLDLEVDCVGLLPTATVSPTSTPSPPGPPAQVSVTLSTTSVGCAASSAITVDVNDANGNPPATGTGVTLSTTLGSINPGANQTTNADGKAIAFFIAPTTGSGTATITATSGSASGTAQVSLTCAQGTAASNSTVAPPPTIGAGTGSAVIRPPNTGDGGLKTSGPGTAVVVVATASLLLLGTLTMTRRDRDEEQG